MPHVYRSYQPGILEGILNRLGKRGVRVFPALNRPRASFSSAARSHIHTFVVQVPWPCRCLTAPVFLQPVFELDTVMGFAKSPVALSSACFRFVHALDQRFEVDVEHNYPAL